MGKRILIDAGHGSIVNGEYVTPGKRSPRFRPLHDSITEEVVLYEGVANRLLAQELQFRLLAKGVEAEIIAPENKDMGINTRVNRVKEMCKQADCFGISIHLNASNSVPAFDQAQGAEIWTSENETRSDYFSRFYFEEYMKHMEGDPLKNWRFGKIAKHGNYDKDSAKFGILNRTPCPFVLLEVDFMTNESFVQDFVSNPELRTRIGNWIEDATIRVYNEL